MSKIFERCMNNRVVKFLDKYHIITDRQFGFRKGVSCSDAIADLLDHVYTAIDNRKFVASMFIDLKKAYDTVNHKILLDKMEVYGIRGPVLRWFESYLSGRSQRVLIGSSFSSIQQITIGIPQGSVLGGLLFSIYINDLPGISDVLHCVLFADDTCVTLAENDYNTLINKFNTELEKITSWLACNRLSLNVTKTVAINF